MCADPSLPTLTQAYSTFLTFIEQEVAELGGPGALPLLVGHNIGKFDVPLLLNSAKRLDLPFPREARMLDTYTAAKQLLVGPSKPPDSKFTLGSLFTHLLQLPTLAAHRGGADVEMTVGVLRALIEHSAGMHGDEGFARFFNRSTLPPAFDYGKWVAHVLDVSNASTFTKPGARRKSSAVKSAFVFGSQAVSATMSATAPPTRLLASLPTSTSQAPLSSSPSTSFSEDDFSAEAWAADDPLTAAEATIGADMQQQYTQESHLSYTALTEAHASWRALALDPSLSSTFLTQPVEKLKRSLGGSSKCFTPTEIKALQSAEVPRLIDVLESYPRGYTSSIAGLLPDPQLSAEGEEQAVSVAVRLVDIKVFSKSKSSASSFVVLNAMLEAVTPQEAGIAGDAATAAVLEHSHSGRQTRFSYTLFRRGRAAWFAVSKEEEKLRREWQGVFGLAGRVVPSQGRSGAFNGPDTWEINPSSVETFSLQTLKELVSAGESHVRVSYPQKGKIPSEKMAVMAGKALNLLREQQQQWEDPVPLEIRERYGLPGYLEALEGMHGPTSTAHFEACRQRLAFQELLVLQLKLLLQRATLRLPTSDDSGGEQRQGVRVTSLALVELARRGLPYELTRSQDRAVTSIMQGMSSWPSMMALLQGDVGCGKTAVAMLAVMAVAGNGFQAAIMAPTEILAEQHFKNFKRMIEDARAVAAAADFSDDASASAAASAAVEALPQVALLTGSTRRAERAHIYAGLEDGSLQVVIGTHALIAESVTFARLGFAVIDEQHKFGVGQRAALLGKGSPSPHILSMSATPIPRSLALVAHGELSLITIDELPPGRLPVATTVLVDEPTARAEVYEHMRREVAAGGQVYIVCPLVDGKSSSTTSSSSSEDEDYSSIVGGGGGDLKAAVLERDRLIAEGELSAEQCGVLHGRMSSEEKEFALAAFAAGRTPVLISTTVVEVGVDVPAASMMLVEHADRFGLAQLHQLRGRVGRGGRASACYLITDKGGPEADRLRILERNASGFDVAEADFSIRGAGEVIGRRQSGREAFGALKVCSLPQDGALVEVAREAAAMLMAASGGRPVGWSRELLAAVVDPALVDLDLRQLPNVAG